MKNDEILVQNGFWNEQALGALEDFNMAIIALYALDAGDFSGMLIPTEAVKYIDENIDFNGWAEKLEKLRALVFCNGINWNGVLRKQKNEGDAEA